MNQTILIIEDEREIRKLLRATLEANGFAPIEAENARDGRLVIVSARPDLVILDLGLPDQDGQEFLADLREWSKLPVIVLSAREREAEKVAALENGADDYVTKPFAAGELVARIRVALRHAAQAADHGVPVHIFGDLNVDLSARSVRLAGEEVRLTPIEYSLLAILVRHAGKVLTYSQLSREIWGRHAADGNQRLRIHTQHLREKLGDDPIAPRFILTEPGIGYRFRAEPPG